MISFVKISHSNMYLCSKYNFLDFPYTPCVQLNQQYIVEGFSAGFLMLLGGLGLIVLEKAARVQTRYICKNKRYNIHKSEAQEIIRTNEQ